MKHKLIFPSVVVVALVITGLSMGLIYVAQVVFFAIAVLFLGVLYKAIRTGLRNRHSHEGVGGDQ